MDTKDLTSYVMRANAAKKRCECGGFLAYSNWGYFECKECGKKIKDAYGQIKELLEAHPSMTKRQIAAELDISYKEVQSYFEDNVLINPMDIVYDSAVEDGNKRKPIRGYGEGKMHFLHRK